ncbi:hypothetical protein MCOR08_008542 [Pyricularia oryzae]|nr:hypothetical protein MCOR32_005916 [Pyricularia oryzae]KAI6421075.1 hypothetical protein MCOR24_004448 [Pyricularia oryzae]KAI6444510.1 hypothetical protein MCOR22_004830 [Pyricularia oryzae]KAI6620752.1 hypothetical protein MCOR08_008542 [Pyricularia oryzae]
MTLVSSANPATFLTPKTYTCRYDPSAKPESKALAVRNDGLKGNLVPRELTVGTFLIACAGYIAVFLLQACSESTLSDSDPTTRAVRHIRNEIAYDRFDRSVMNWLRS